MRLEQQLQERLDQMDELQQTVRNAKEDLEKRSLDREALKKDSHLLQFYTGVIKKEMFINVY